MSMVCMPLAENGGIVLVGFRWAINKIVGMGLFPAGGWGWEGEGTRPI